MFFAIDSAVSGLLLLLAAIVHGRQASSSSSNSVHNDGHGGHQQPCARRFFQSDSFVCACNATYCDTIAPPPSKAPAGHILVYTSAKEDLRFHEDVLQFQETGGGPCPAGGSQAFILCINSSELRQEMVGFGGSFTDAFGINLRNLSTDAQQRLMESYFSSSGLEYNLARVPIGGTDFSPRPYSYDDDAVGDLELRNFTLQVEDHDYKIPFIRQAFRLATSSLKMVATAWSPPAWMKINDMLYGFGWLKGATGGPYYDIFAQYHIRFLEEYDKNGIQFWAVTPVNEPVSGLIPFYSFNCLGFTPGMLKVFVNHNLGPALRRSRFNSTKVLIYDLGRLFLNKYVDAIMSDPDVDKYVDGVALHWYHDPIVPSSAVDKVHNLYSNKFLLMTEACITPLLAPGPPVVLGSWQRAEVYAYHMIENLQHWVTGWIDWNMALNLEGGPSWSKNYVDAPVIVDGGQDEFYKQPMFYAIGHFSKFVTPGSRAIDVVNGEKTCEDLASIAFLRPDSAIVFVVLNRQDQAVSVNITDTHFGSFQAQVPKHSLQTYIWWTSKDLG